MQEGKKIYFASDFHLGVPDHASSLKREKLLVKWLDEIKADAEEIYLVGDIFDFWFEYKRATPKGFARLLGKLAELTDSGIPVTIFTGNHDMWMFDYLPQEIGITLHRNNIERTHNNKLFYLGHGDGIGPGDHGYKFIKKVFANKVCQWLFARLHPNFGIWLANYFSKSSREATGTEAPFLDEKEWQVMHCRELLKIKHYDYFIFGHRHIPTEYMMDKSKFVNLGDWITHFTYAEFDGNDLRLKSYAIS